MKNHREDVNSNDENKKGAAYLMKWRKKDKKEVMQGDSANSQNTQQKQNRRMTLPEFIAKKNLLIEKVFIVAVIFCAVCAPFVEVNYDLTEYLPETTETRQGLDIMNREFTTFGSAKVLVSNITYDKALALSKEIGDIRGISGVTF